VEAVRNQMRVLRLSVTHSRPVVLEYGWTQQNNTLMDEIPPGFWRAVAEGFIQGQLNKPLFGRPYLKFGQCFGLWGYLVELGGILGAKHARKPDAFVDGFLGMSGAAGAAKRMLVEQAKYIIQRHSLQSMTFSDYVGADVIELIGYKGDGWHSYVMEMGAQKSPRDVVLKRGWEYASAGAALGAIYPDVLRAMFDRTHKRVPEKEWRFRYVAGLDIGPEQPQTSYGEAEQTENKNFMEYCRQARPHVYPILKG
jgi:hypothetical protein